MNAALPVILQDGTYTYVYGHGLISQTNSGGTQSYFLANGLGSTEKLTSGNGNVTATYKYDVFGAIRSQTGSGSTEYKFTGHQDDATLGYTYLRARYYDPATGRFLGKDPFSGLPTNPASQHHFTYVQDNPANLTDPSGLWTLGLCVNLVLGLPGQQVTVTVCPIVVASNGEVGATLTGGFVGSTGYVAGISAGPQFSSGKRLTDLEGPFLTGGASARLGRGAGADVFWDGNRCKESVWGGSLQRGLGGDYTPPILPAEAHAGVTTTAARTWFELPFNLPGHSPPKEPCQCSP